MKKYQSHKVVEAARIISCGFEEDGSGWVQYYETNGETIHIDLSSGFVRPGHAARPGDYIVRYSDGYLSWSPRKAFEEGYTVMNDWKERLKSEYADLCERLDKLRGFIVSDHGLSETAVSLLKRQEKAMEDYFLALSERLEQAGLMKIEREPIEKRGDAITVTVSAPAGKQALVFLNDDQDSARMSVAPGTSVTIHTAPDKTLMVFDVPVGSRADGAPIAEIANSADPA